MLVHPYRGLPNPADDTPLVVYDDKSDPTRLQVRFVPVQDSDNFGYIEHVLSSKIVRPQEGSDDPGNDTRLVYHSRRHGDALFRFNEENKEIEHISGKVWHPFKGLRTPENDTECVLYNDHHDASKFYFGDVDGNPISPYPAPKVSDK